jgi:hypothetical protein
LSLGQEVEPGSLNDFGPASGRIGSEENRGFEDALKRGYQAAVLFSSPVHSERVEHLGGGSEPDRLVLLLNGQGRQEDRHDPVLPEGHPEGRMPGNLEHEVSVPALIQELPCRRFPYWQTAEDEWTRTEAERLVPLLALDSDQFDPFDFGRALFGYPQVLAQPFQNRSGRLHSGTRASPCDVIARECPLGVVHIAAPS